MRPLRCFGAGAAAAFNAGMATLGTAGHIDHGKTALVRALTGVDTDRLPEEKARGISIALGYAALDLPSGRRFSVVDVPGHERFVRTMVAGATGIDLYLMVVAADDGVMPQTREHAAVLEALGVLTGVVAVTKADLADPERAAGEAAELLPGAEIVAVSARDGRGLDDLRAALDRAAAGVTGRASSDGPLRLHVDRSFTIHGAGTVVTGTLWSGRAARGDEVTVLPAGRRARVRSVQVHDEQVESAEAGQRVALNLAGLGRDEVERGDVIVAGAGAPEPTYRVEARLVLTDSPARVIVHHGTRESPARVRPIDGDRWLLRLDQPIVAVDGDRIVIRSIAPPDTLGGGHIVDAHAGGRAPAAPAPAAEPATPGLPPLSPAALAVEQRLREAGATPPLDADLQAPGELAALRAHGRAVRVGPAMHYHAEVLEETRARLVAVLEAEGSITLARFRDELGFSRKYAQALLEHFDGEKVTLRRGDERVLRRRR
jgi:selenocysteine-specific elongation factor